MWKHTDGLIEFRRYEATLLLSIHGVPKHLTILRSVRIERAISIVLIVDRGTAFHKNSVEP